MKTDSARLSTGSKGYGLVELMVALAIGLFISGAVVSLFVTSKSSYRAQEGVDAVLENGRYAIRALADDVRLAGYVGVTYDPIKVSPQIYTATAVTGACAANWVNIGQPIFGLNASAMDGMGSNAGATFTDCIPAADYKAGTDILVLRHAEGQAVTALAANTIYLLTELDRGSFFLRTTAPVTAPAAETNPSAIHEMNIHVYYIRRCSVTNPGDSKCYPVNDPRNDGIPTLVRETLIAGPAMVAQPLVEGIESMQISYGVDTTSPGDKVVDRYYPASSLSTDTAVSPNWTQVVAVRIELLVRTPLGDGGFANDTNSYTLGDVAIPAANDRFRRGVYSTTVMLRNHRKT